MINYVFYFNSDGLVYSPTADAFIGRAKDADHLPSLDGYLPGDKLTVAYEGRFDETGNDDTGFSEINEETGKRIAEKLFQKFNAPWERPNEYAGPSMSVGDVVTLLLGNGAILSYSCERLGFRKLASGFPLDMSISVIRPSWTRSPARR